MEEEKSFDLLCYDFTNEIISIINNSNLPVSVVYYLLKDIFEQVGKEKDRVIITALEKRNGVGQDNVAEVPITIKDEGEKQ